MFSAILGTPSVHATTSRRSPFRRVVIHSLIVTVSAAALIGSTGSYASAETANDSLTANVQVGNAISLTGLTPSFTLGGVPGVTDTEVGAVTFTVTTNNFAGYNVTVTPATSTMISDTPGNTDSIPTTLLQVRESEGATAYVALGVGTPRVVHSQETASAELGDELSNDYRITVPFVRDDTYSATLDYVATTL